MISTAIELFFAITLGLLFGNLLTSFYHRILTNKPINGIFESGMKPHCANCYTELKYYEYFPVLSWISCRFRCNYCGTKIPIVYFLLEIISMFIALILWLIIGFTSLFIFLFFLALTFILLIALYLGKKVGS